MLKFSVNFRRPSHSFLVTSQYWKYSTDSAHNEPAWNDQAHNHPACSDFAYNDVAYKDPAYEGTLPIVPAKVDIYDYFYSRTRL